MNTVLIVEDEKMIRQGIKSMILRSGVPIRTVIECNNGQAALEILQSQKIDVMFTDIRMPKMDGIALVREIEKTPNKPLTVVISGYDDFSYAVEMLRHGVREYILKPVEREKITEILKKLDDEIAAVEKDSEEIRNIGYQQLKYLMLNQDITSKETEVMVKRFEHQFFQGDYAVCCTNFIGDEFEQHNAYIYLRNVEKQGIFIVDYVNKDFLLRNELKNYYVGVSLPHKGLAELRNAYLEARKSRKKAFAKNEHVVEYSVRQEDSVTQEIDNILIDQIIQRIGTQNGGDAIQLLEEIKRKVQKEQYSMDSFDEQMIHLVDGIAHTYQNVLEIKKEEIHPYRNMYTYADIDVYLSDLIEWMQRFNQMINSQFDDYKNKQKIQQAIAYIEQNYNKDLNMAVVSNHISMNYSLFSYLFKQYTGSNFVNYLKDIRIKEAKRLLAETELRVNEISQAVGYENEKHFMKIFKSVCGVSPTEYRKNTLFTA